MKHVANFVVGGSVFMLVAAVILGIAILDVAVGGWLIGLLFIVGISYGIGSAILNPRRPKGE